MSIKSYFIISNIPSNATTMPLIGILNLNLTQVLNPTSKPHDVALNLPNPVFKRDKNASFNYTKPKSICEYKS